MPEMHYCLFCNCADTNLHQLLFHLRKYHKLDAEFKPVHGEQNKMVIVFKNFDSNEHHVVSRPFTPVAMEPLDESTRAIHDWMEKNDRPYKPPRLLSKLKEVGLDKFINSTPPVFGPHPENQLHNKTTRLISIPRPTLPPPRGPKPMSTFNSVYMYRPSCRGYEWESILPPKVEESEAELEEKEDDDAQSRASTCGSCEYDYFNIRAC